MKILTAAVLAVAMLGAMGPAQAQTQTKRVQCWTDDKGQRACGDRVPPQYAKQERQIFDAQGRVVQTRPREKTDAELAADEAAARAAAERRQREQKEQDYDRFLLSTFNSVADLERARDERLQILTGRRQLLDRTIADNEKAVAQQQQRVGNAGKNNKKVPGEMTKKLGELRQTLIDNRQAAEQIDAEKRQISDKYAADIARYRHLRGSAPGAADANR